MSRSPALCAACVLAGTALIGAWAPQAQVRFAVRPDGAVDRATQWVDAVLRHTARTRDGAVDRVGRWSGQSLTDLLIELASIRTLMRDSHARVFTVPVELDNGRPQEIRYSGAERRALEAAVALITQRHLSGPDFVARALALHSDVASLSDGTGILLRISDARPVGNDRFPADHWLTARRLGDTLGSRDGRDGDLAFWYRATLASMVAVENWNAAHAERALARFPDDAELQFLAGCQHERLAAARTQAFFAANRLPPGLTVRVGSAPSELREAAARLKRALDLNSRHSEARIHYGRVLTLAGQPAAAVPELRRAAADSQPPELRYYAQLFLGAALESAGQPDGARAAYRQAADLFPFAQSPSLALSQLAYAAGTRTDAAEAIVPILALPADEDQRIDPWWRYFVSAGRDADVLLAEASHRLTAPRRGPS